MSEEEAPHRLTLRAIEVFVAVVEEGSFAAGAKRLAASPSSVSQQIANLEEALGARLIERQARPLALTPAGFLFQRRALAILDQAAAARADLIEMDLASLPELRLAVLEDFDATALPTLVHRLTAALPRCRFIAHSGLSHQNLLALESRAVDIIVAAETETQSDWLEVHPLVQEPLIVMTAPGLLPARASTEAQTKRLAQAPFVRYEPDQVIGRQIEAHLRRLRLDLPRHWAFQSTTSIAAMLLHCQGWAMTTPCAYLSLPERLAVDVHPLPFQGTSRTISLYARRGALGSLPASAAQILRQEITRQTLAPALARMPWLEGQMRVLGAEESVASITS
ncbi:MAG: LysR family transcriptional regulator [Pseudomonadota bacterium]